MNPFDTIATTLVTIGGINWGLVGVADTDLVAAIFGRRTVASRVVYGLVGAAAAYSVVRFALRVRTKEPVNVQDSIEVDVPLRTAYDQWTQFESFPRFMSGVQQVTQIDDTHLQWVAKIDGVVREWETEITEQKPDERVAWRSTDGTENSGVVTFHRLGEDRTLVTVQMAFEPQGAIEAIGDAMGAIRMRTRGDLQRFKAFIESRGTETGAWRGTVERADQRRSA
jgi:uncharacterized membrane protein